MDARGCGGADHHAQILGVGHAVETEYHLGAIEALRQVVLQLPCCLQAHVQGDALILATVPGDARQGFAAMVANVQTALGGEVFDGAQQLRRTIAVGEVQAAAVQGRILQGFQHSLATINGQQAATLRGGGDVPGRVPGGARGRARLAAPGSTAISHV